MAISMNKPRRFDPDLRETPAGGLATRDGEVENVRAFTMLADVCVKVLGATLADPLDQSPIDLPAAPSPNTLELTVLARRDTEQIKAPPRAHRPI
jgi:hypothetical protein